MQVLPTDAIVCAVSALHSLKASAPVEALIDWLRGGKRFIAPECIKTDIIVKYRGCCSRSAGYELLDSIMKLRQRGLL